MRARGGRSTSSPVGALVLGVTIAVSGTAAGASSKTPPPTPATVAAAATAPPGQVETGADPRDVDTTPDRLRLARNAGAIVAVLALLVVAWWLSRG